LCAIWNMVFLSIDFLPFSFIANKDLICGK
jgi:hypothetical protein